MGLGSVLNKGFFLILIKKEKKMKRGKKFRGRRMRIACGFVKGGL
jgi:hypothetical protein